MNSAVDQLAPPLARVGHVQVMDQALKHAYVHECRTVLTVTRGSRETVIGTSNEAKEPRCELYGWNRNTAAHIDGYGFIYFLPIELGTSRVYVSKNKRRQFVRLEPGTVYRLDDREVHWTFDRAPVICLYVGWFKEPYDALAMAMMQVGAARLANGTPDAPRVSQGFRAPMPWECYILENEDQELVPIAKARAKGWTIITCAADGCKNPAAKLDGHFPYFMEKNRCYQHLGEPK